ncbi:thioesterase II family protein [Streptomyces sp. NPDC002309]
MAGEAPASPWFRRIRGARTPRLRIVCFPHAGGAASFFRSWASLVPEDVEVLAVRYPGREDRLFETPADRMEALADPLADACASLAGGPLVLFGHSMGASVAFEVAARLARAPGPVGPAALFVSGRAGPGRQKSRGLADATDAELVENLVAMRGMTAQALADEELRDLLLPAVRADYRLIERYTTSVATPVLDVPVVAYYGDADEEIGEGEVSAWSSVTRSAFTVRAFPGGHFYLEEQAASVVADLFAQLDRR